VSYASSVVSDLLAHEGMPVYAVARWMRIRHRQPPCMRRSLAGRSDQQPALSWRRNRPSPPLARSERHLKSEAGSIREFKRPTSNLADWFVFRLTRPKPPAGASWRWLRALTSPVLPCPTVRSGARGGHLDGLVEARRELVPWRSAPGQFVAALEQRLHVGLVEGFPCGHVEVGRDVGDVVVDAVPLAVAFPLIPEPRPRRFIPDTASTKSGGEDPVVPNRRTSQAVDSSQGSSVGALRL